MQGQRNIDELEASPDNAYFSEWYVYVDNDFSSARTCFVNEV